MITNPEPWIIRPLKGNRSRLIGGITIARHLRADGLPPDDHLGNDLIYNLPPELLRDKLETKGYGVKFTADFVQCELNNIQDSCEGGMIEQIELTGEGVVILLDNGCELFIRGGVFYGKLDKQLTLFDLGVEIDKSYSEPVPTRPETNLFSIRRRDSPEKYDGTDTTVIAAPSMSTIVDILRVD